MPDISATQFFEENPLFTLIELKDGSMKKSYKSIMNSLNEQIDSLREMEQAYENKIVELGDTNISLRKRIDELQIEYQELSVKYDSLMQNSILPMEG